MQKFAIALVQGAACGLVLGLVLLVGGGVLRPAALQAQNATETPAVVTPQPGAESPLQSPTVSAAVVKTLDDILKKEQPTPLDAELAYHLIVTLRGESAYAQHVPTLLDTAVIDADSEHRLVTDALAKFYQSRPPGQPVDDTTLRLLCLTIAQNRRILDLLETPREEVVQAPVTPTNPTTKPTPVKTVYISRSGKKYHTADCQFVTRNSTSLSLTEAKRQGYIPCEVCNPPK